MLTFLNNANRTNCFGYGISRLVTAVDASRQRSARVFAIPRWHTGCLCWCCFDRSVWSLLQLHGIFGFDCSTGLLGLTKFAVIL
jgi:hypothetical protein